MEDEHRVPEYYQSHKGQYDSGLAFLKEHPCQEYSIQSRDGLRLAGCYIANPEAVRTVLLCHGYHGGPLADFAPALRFYYESGCSIFLINERAHRASEGKYITFGMRESEDIADWANFIDTLPHAAELPLFLTGISMGAASVMLATAEKLPGNAAGIIADCGYCNAWTQITGAALRGLHIPKFPLLYVAELYCRIFAHFSMKEKVPEEAMRKNRYPVLFIHGKADSFVLPSNTIRDYEACASPKSLCLVDDAGHAFSYLTDTARYEAAVRTFFEKYT